MNYRSQLVGAWMGIAAMLIMFIGLWPLMHFLPPLKPGLGQAELAAIYRANATGIITGGIFQMLACSIFMLYFSALALQLKRMEATPLWTYTLLLTSVLGFVPVLVAEMLLSAAAYRPERPDEIIQAFSDLGFFLFVGPALPGAMQMLSVAFAVLGDRNAEPVFPRWVGYFSIWTAVLALPGAVVTLFKVGPFAWNGVLAFWVAAIAFGLWINVTFWATRRAILRQMQTGAA
jgi:hypothetical protein